MKQLFFILLVSLLSVTGVAAQTADGGEGAVEGAMNAEIANPEMEGFDPRAATGGAQTLEDILARQNQQKIDDSFRRSEIGDAPTENLPGQLAPRGGESDSEIWRALRYGHDSVSVSAGGDTARVLIQDGGMRWLSFREGPLVTYGLWALGGMLILLALFYLLRGRVPIQGGKTGTTILRFAFFERMSHWVLAGSFILLGITGILSLIGRKFIAPTFGKDANASLLEGTKYIHDNVSWAFMLSLVVVFVLWVAHNIPDRLDLKWVAEGGGLFGDKHPPAKKFNAGQKIIFWSVILLGGSLSLSGLSLLFPFELPLFAKTFGIINDLGLPGLFGLDPLPRELAPQEEMQLAQSWHAIVAFVMMAIILGHIYIGTLGMEGAFDAMGDGQVDEAWAEQHHSIWYEKKKTADASSGTPAE
ncbi:formate dehydrogenase subunit gamma [Palleronia caenipelagi]|uniref:Formate dehydrogenase subunit gamma n=1 Tax=Palleronia caenipelagi TaxID=2489174 RepID=A0A547Q9E7_9RHOB|nr:formate dehydrogenase subunit gamma [Palleronia caenipelagi]TRD23019.1 formate dehydrogenase subunit gamma [Palleronia caenipelagi]